MELHDFIMLIVVVVSFFGMYLYEERFLARSILFMLAIVRLIEELEKKNWMLAVVCAVFAILIFIMNTVSRKWIALERPHYTYWQIPILILLFLVLYSYSGKQQDITNVAARIIVALVTTWIVSLFLKACFFELFGFLFVFVHKKEYTETHTVIRTGAHSSMGYRHPSQFIYYYEVLAEKRRVDFSKEYQKIFPKSLDSYEYRRTISYKKSFFFNSIIITKIK